MDTNQMLYSSGISVGFYALYKLAHKFYHSYYLTSECHQRSLEIRVVEREEEKDEKAEKKETVIEMTKK